MKFFFYLWAYPSFILALHLWWIAIFISVPRFLRLWFKINKHSETYRGIVNDTYKMDLILIHPPHLIALACIYIASVFREKDTTAWFEELRVDMNVVSSVSSMLYLTFFFSDSFLILHWNSQVSGCLVSRMEKPVREFLINDQIHLCLL